MIDTRRFALMTLALAGVVSTAFAKTSLFSDGFSDPDAPGWTSTPFPPHFSVVNQEFVLSADFGPMNTEDILENWTGASHAIPISGALPDQETLELRADFVGANQDDAGASIHYFDGTGEGYIFGMTQDVVLFYKFWDGGLNNSGALFFYEHSQLKNHNVTLVLAVTRLESSLEITTRVLDKDNASAVLFERTVTDTPEADPVLPSRAGDGMLSYPDQPGTPWPVFDASGRIVLSMTWFNQTEGSEAAAQVNFDNVEVWQYESPQLSIQNAVVLSWGVTEGEFVLESAPSAGGPWEPVPDPWWRTNAGRNEVCVLAPENTRVFRLRQVEGQ